MKFILSLFFLILPYLNLYADPLFHWTTKTGAQVTLYQAMELPILNIRVAFRAGSAYDGPHFGLSALTTDLLNQGNQGQSADHIIEQLANTGAQYQAETTRDAIVLSLKTLTDPEKLKRATHLFSDILQYPDFPIESIERQKQQQVQLILQRKDRIDTVADDAFYETLYQNHPYGHPVEGTEKTLKNITRADIQTFYRTYFTASNTTLVLVGALSVNEAKELAEQLTAHLSTRHPNVSLPALPNALSAPKTLHIPYHSTQTALRIGQFGIDYQSPDYFPLLVGNYILGGGNLISILGDTLREKEGLTYGIYSQFASQTIPGPFVIQCATQHHQLSLVKNLIFRALTNFIQTGPSEKQLIAAKQYLTGSFPVSISSNESMARLLLTLRFYHLPDDYLSTYLQRIEAVSIHDIQDAFSRHLHPNQWFTLEVGPHE